MLDSLQSDFHVGLSDPRRFGGELKRRVHICPLYLVRTASLPISVLRGLTASSLVSGLEDAQALAGAADQRAALLADELHEAIGTIKSEPELKSDMRLLIEARRSIFNGKRVKHLEETVEAVRRHRANSLGLLEAWIDLTERLGVLRESLAGLMEIQGQQARRSLRETSASTRFADSLALVNPELAAQVAAFRQAESRDVRHKDRQIEASLYQFISRTATKPSPLSQLCVTSYGIMAPDGGSNVAADPMGADIVSRVRLNMSLLARIRDRADVISMQREHLRIVLNSSVRLSEKNRFEFLRTRLRPIQQLAVFSSVTTQGMFSVSRGAVADGLFHSLADGAALPIGICIAKLAQTGIDPKRAGSEIKQLLERGFIEAAPDTERAGYDDAMRNTGRALQEVGMSPLAQNLEAIVELSTRLGTTTGPERLALLREARQTGNALCEAAGLATNHNGNAVLYEDTVQRPRMDVAGLNDPSLRQAVEQLGPVLPLLDGLLPTRLAIREAFIRQFGELGICRDVGLFADDIARLRNATHAEETGSLQARAPIDEALLSHASPLRQKEMRQALTARRAAYLHLRRRAFRAGAGPIVLSEQDLARFSDAVSESSRPDLSLAGLFMQGDLRGGWVANQIATGGCQFMSRFIDHWALEGNPEPLEAARTYLRSITPAGAIFAEIAGHDASTLNLHPCLTELTVKVPNEWQTGEPAETCTLRDLSIAYDPDRGRLNLYETNGRRVLPVYLGGLSSTLLPSVQQLLLLLGPTLRLPRLGWHHLLKDETAETLRPLPEVRVGALVLFRRSWMVPFAMLDMPAAASELDIFEQVRLWRERCGIAPRCFAVLPEGEGKQWRGSRWSKPSFVDFESPHSISWLVKEARQSSGHFFLSDALPDPALASAETHTREFILDLAIGDHHG